MAKDCLETWISKQEKGLARVETHRHHCSASVTLCWELGRQCAAMAAGRLVEATTPSTVHMAATASKNGVGFVRSGTRAWCNGGPFCAGDVGAALTSEAENTRGLPRPRQLKQRAKPPKRLKQHQRAAELCCACGRLRGTRAENATPWRPAESARTPGMSRLPCDGTHFAAASADRVQLSLQGAVTCMLTAVEARTVFGSRACARRGRVGDPATADEGTQNLQLE